MAIVCSFSVASLILALLVMTAHGADTTYHPYAGVIWTVRKESMPRALHIHVFQIDLTQPGLRFLVTNGNPKLTNREAKAATTVDSLIAHQGQIAMNAHFYQPNRTDPNRWIVGFGASEGKIISAFEGPTPSTSMPVGSLTRTQDYAILTHAPALNIDPENRAQIVNCDHKHADLKHVLEPVKIYNAVSGSAQIVTQGATSIPGYTQDAATGLRDGNGWSDKKSWYEDLRSRTAMGLAKDNRTLTLFTVDEAGGSLGMSVREVADMMRKDFAVWNALNLDGGGSTTMAMQDPMTKVRRLINTPSDGSPTRTVATSIVVFAKPLPQK